MNTIELFRRYVALLDEVYRLAATTSVLDCNSALVQEGVNANEVVIPKISMDGLADYSRNSGYVQGNVELTLETVKYNYDRGRKFDVDAMDNVETAGAAFGHLSSEFIRTKVVPEMDAFRYAQYCNVDGISSAVGTLADGKAVLTALTAARNKMDEDEVPADGRILFITPTLLNLAKDVDTTTSKEVLDSFAQIVKVPQSRFYTAIELMDGTSENELAGGFKKAETGADINFMAIHKPAIIQTTKHTVNKIITPEENQTSDGYMFFYRAYGLADAYENKASGIYLHRKNA